MVANTQRDCFAEKGTGAMKLQVAIQVFLGCLQI